MARTSWFLFALLLAACPGPAAQPDVPTLPKGGSIPGDHPRPPVAGGDGDTDDRPAIPAEAGPPPQPMEVADEAFRAAQPAAAKPRALNIPAIQTFTLDNGVRAYLVERHELPIVSVDLVFDGGSMNDPAG
ncbi:MAG TPA: hypothetical protein VL172_01340, partial [Kofleriaceae bacterium]|nr:hypothetical protein [Kofleriaceae bacterium]